MSPCKHIGFRCWSCMTKKCFDEPTEHVWYDEEDIQAAKDAKVAPPTGDCGCYYCGWPALERKSNERSSN